jgi:hypothetical protein
MTETKLKNILEEATDIMYSVSVANETLTPSKHSRFIEIYKELSVYKSQVSDFDTHVFDMFYNQYIGRKLSASKT